LRFAQYLEGTPAVRACLPDIQRGIRCRNACWHRGHNPPKPALSLIEALPGFIEVIGQLFFDLAPGPPVSKLAWWGDHA
jgi:hypothetical protein